MPGPVEKDRLPHGGVQKKDQDCYVILKGANLRRGDDVKIDAKNKKVWNGSVICVGTTADGQTFGVCKVRYDKDGPPPEEDKPDPNPPKEKRVVGAGPPLCVVTVANGNPTNDVNIDIHPA